MNDINQNEFDLEARKEIFELVRVTVHQLLAWGYQDALTNIQPNLEEEAITGLIVKAMKNRIEIDDRFDNYFAGDEIRISGEGRMGKHRRRLDIVVERSGYKPRLEYIFEAKLLRKNGFPISKYTGKDGLQCFINGIYASECPEAAMIGYIQSNDCDRWETELKNKFDNDPDNTFKIKKKLQRVSVIKDIPYEWLSEHERRTRKPILIYHIFLDCLGTSL